MPSHDASIQWFEARKGKVVYSMSARLGPNSYDCSSAVYLSLIAGGFLPSGTMGNTETLFGSLESIGWKQTPNPKRGDIFIWGVRGASDGAGGHTGMFIDSSTVIHCNYGANGISIDNYQFILKNNGGMPSVIYTDPKNDGGNNPTPPPKRVLSKEQQVAVDIRNVLSKEGYTIQAIAAICGNADVECGMRPDISEIGGGGGYGVVQWTSPNAWESGANYVQRLLREAGIDGDYKLASTQAKLIHYGMFHGQWIGVVSPTDANEFIKGTNVDQLTIAFLKNFERAGVEKTQARTTAAKKWFDFLFNYKEGDYDDPTPENTKEKLRNVGEIDQLGIKNGKVFVKGWHFSSDLPMENIEIYNAETAKLIYQFNNIPIKIRNDIKEKYPNVEDVEKSGFELSFTLKANEAIFIKGIRTDGQEKEELYFDNLLMFEPVENAPVDNYAEDNRKFFFEIFEKGKLVARGNKILNTLSWSNELMYVPTTSLVLPITYREYFKGREEVKIYINNKVFHGITSDYDVDKELETITIQLDHIISEWEFRQVSTNLACKNRTINDIFSTLDFRYSNKWHLDYLQNSSQKRIDYVYSRQNKLEALTKTCELTDDIWWRVGFNFGRKLEFGTFGETKPVQISSVRNAPYRLISEPKIDYQFDQVINMATVYGEKSDSGMSSMSLREVYLEPHTQIKGFPVRVLRKGINNERGYDYINLAKIASNNNVEYTVIDEQSVRDESNISIEASYSFNDLAPFAVNDKKISDEDRNKATRTAYETAVKRLKQARRKYYIDITTTELPSDINVGDQIRLLYDNNKLITEGCSEYQKEIMKMSDWYYILKIDYNFDETGLETNRLTLSKNLSIERKADER